MSQAIELRFEKLEKLVAVAEAKGLDPEIAASHCKLGCVMICGAIERSVEILITERIGKKSAPQVTSFLKSFFKRGTNYDCDAILDLLHKFDGTWGQNFKSYIEKNDRIKSSVASCYATRNSIAHGGTQSLGPAILRQYFDHSFEMITELSFILK